MKQDQDQNQDQDSFEKFDYTLRPAKNIERKMLCEAFGRFTKLSPLAEYAYIGLGSISFKDFILVHERLGLTDMISIERARAKEERFSFNKPYSCIKLRWGNSSEILPTLSWRKRSTVWLDYDSPLDSSILEDISTATLNLRSGSILVVTVDAKPERLADSNGSDTGSNIGSKIVKERLEALRTQIGENKLPRGTKGSHLAKWGLAKVCRDVITNEIEETLSRRNRPLEKKRQLGYQQLFNFHYADGAKMLTVGGYFVNDDDLQKIPVGTFDDLEFVRLDEEPYLIDVPVLTWRETSYLDARLPRSAPDVAKPLWLPPEDRQKYGKLYRYFPTYLEAEM
jgi:hypothetical protein